MQEQWSLSRSIVGAISIFALSLPIAAAERQDDAGTPTEQYAALLKEYRPASGGMRNAETDVQRKTAVERLGKFPQRFLDLADKYPNDPIALHMTASTRLSSYESPSSTLTPLESPL